MSALPPIADIGRPGCDVRFVPLADIAPPALFDHLVGAAEQVERHGEAKRLGGLEVDRQLDFVRGLNRKLGSASRP